MNSRKMVVIVLIAAFLPSMAALGAGSPHEIELKTIGWIDTVPYCRIEWQGIQSDAYEWGVVIDLDGRSDTGFQGFEQWLYIAHRNWCDEFGQFERPFIETTRGLLAYNEESRAWSTILSGDKIPLSFPTHDRMVFSIDPLRGLQGLSPSSRVYVLSSYMPFQGYFWRRDETPLSAMVDWTKNGDYEYVNPDPIGDVSGCAGCVLMPEFEDSVDFLEVRIRIEHLFVGNFEQ